MAAIQDPTMVICIDGPTRGRLRSVKGGERTRFHAYDMPLPPPLIPRDHSLDWDNIIMPVLTYHVHTISFLGFGIRVASMQLNPADIDPYDVITALFNESGRQATYRVSDSV